MHHGLAVGAPARDLVLRTQPAEVGARVPQPCTSPLTGADHLAEIEKTVPAGAARGD